MILTITEVTDMAVRIEYMCRYCGQKIVKSDTTGRPAPGCCSKRPKTSSGAKQPHSWVVNRRMK